MMITILFWLGVLGLILFILLVVGMNEKTDKVSGKRLSPRHQLVGLSVCLCLGAIALRLLYAGHLEQTAALFIGLPTLLSILLALTPNAKSATGMIMKGITLGLLMSGIVFAEGFICILMAAPLFYGVGLLLGAVDDRERRRKQKAAEGNILASVVLLPLVVMSFEGVTSELSFPRSEIITVEKTIAATPAEVRHALAQRPVFDQELPFYLKLGFPRPTNTQGAGLQLGDQRIVRFAGGEGQPGDLVLTVSDSRPGLIVFSVDSDTSHIAHWLDWKEFRVGLHEIQPGQTYIRWTAAYDRRLDPAWYFAPWQRYAVRLAGEYLIDTIATPQEQRQGKQHG